MRVPRPPAGAPRLRLILGPRACRLGLAFELADELLLERWESLPVLWLKEHAWK